MTAPRDEAATSEDARQGDVMALEPHVKATLPQRAIHETKELVILTAYLYVTLGAVIAMKTAVLHTRGIEFAPWGIAIVKALLLAKFMLLGRALKIGERDNTHPLIWPTLRRAFAFLVLLVALTTIEEIVVGLFHRQSIAESLGELFGHRLEETLAGIFIMLLVLVPYFAFRVLSEVLGEGRLTRMFFFEREPTEPNPPAIPASSPSRCRSPSASAAAESWSWPPTARPYRPQHRTSTARW